MSTCGVCVQPFDFMSSESPRGHDICVLMEERDNLLSNIDETEQIAYIAVESYGVLEKEVRGLKSELADTLAELAEFRTENGIVKEETELC